MEKDLTSIKEIMLASNTRHTVVKQYLDTKDYHITTKMFQGINVLEYHRFVDREPVHFRIHLYEDFSSVLPSKHHPS